MPQKPGEAKPPLGESVDVVEDLKGHARHADVSERLCQLTALDQPGFLCRELEGTATGVNLSAAGATGKHAVLDVVNQGIEVPVRAALNHGVGHPHQRMVKAVLCASSSVRFEVKPAGGLPVVEVLREHTVADEHLFSGVHALVIDWIRAIASLRVGSSTTVTMSEPIFWPRRPSRHESPAATRSASQGCPKASWM